MTEGGVQATRVSAKTKGAGEVRELLRRLVDTLPEEELHAARRFLEYLHAELAPLDDEALSAAMAARLDEAHEDFKAGRWVSHQELMGSLADGDPLVEPGSEESAPA